MAGQGKIAGAMMESKDQAQAFLTGEILSFSLLGRIFYGYPEREWLEGLMKNQAFEEAPLAPDQPEVRDGLELISAWLEGRSPEEALSSLESDYLRLFVGTGAHVLAPPWESVYVSAEPLLFQPETLEVRKWYARFGLEARNKAHEPDDHAGLELEFLAHLAGLALKALDQGDESGLQEAMAAQRAFLQEHLLRWMPTWCGHVEEQARTEFYRGCALMTKGLLSHLREQFDLGAPGA